MDISAPIYQASAAFTPPVAPNVACGIDDVSIAQVLRTPAMLAIVERLAPSIVQAANAPLMKMMSENLTLRNMLVMGPASGSSGDLAGTIDAAFRALPAAERPRYE